MGRQKELTGKDEESGGERKEQNEDDTLKNNKLGYRNYMSLYTAIFYFAVSCKQRVNEITSFIMVALWNRADHYIFMLWFVLLLSYFFPRLISAVADWMSAILPHMVWP